MKQRGIRILLFMAVCLGLLFAGLGAQAAQADGLEVHFVNVGRNDGILIRCGGEDVFIDSGMYRQGQLSTDYMRAAGVSSLKYYIGTHAHSDHVGGAAPIIEAFRPQAVYQPHDGVRERILKSCKTKEERSAAEATPFISIGPGEQLRVGDATLTCLGPMTIVKASASSSKENENSLVLMLTYGETDILLSGDATNSSLRAIAEANPGALAADVYKNARHYGTTKEDVFSCIGAQYTIFSTDKSHMPAKSYLRTLNDHQSELLATSPNHCGNIVLYSDGQHIRFDVQHRAESVQLSQSEVSVYEGKRVKISASVKPSGRAKLLTYSSDNPAVATVDGEGKITGVSSGEAVITVRDASGAQATCLVRVSPATMILRKTALSVKQGSKVSASWKIEPSGSKPTITWASENPEIATVDAKGKITGVYPGTARITATMPGGQVSAITVTVNPIKVSSVKIKPSSVKLTLGESATVSASVSPKNATWPQVTWSSADPSVVTIDAGGTLRAVGVGKTTITATTIEGKSKTVKVTVNPVYVKKIYLTADRTDGLIGGVAGRNQVKLSDEIEPMNATIQTVEWSSSNKKIATVDENGVVTGHQDGSVTITCKATDGSRRYARIKLKFGKNELNRTVKPVEGQLIAEPSRIRYRSSYLEITMTYANRTGMKQTVPFHGMLTLITPDGEQLPLMMLSEKQRELKHKAIKTYTYKIPLSAHPRLNGLDLSACGVTIIDPANR